MLRTVVCSLSALSILWAVSLAEASTLYTLNAAGGLYQVSTDTGAATLVAPLPAGRIWDGLSSRPGSNGSVWATSTPSSFAASYVSRIDVQTGQLYDLHTYTPADLGFTTANARIELTSIAIDPANPSTAALLGLIVDAMVPSASYVAFTIDLEGGALLGPVHEYPNSIQAAALAYSLDGSQLYTTVGGSIGNTTSLNLATLDPTTGDVSPIGPMGFNLATGLAFEPETGDLFGISAYNTDALVRLSAATGAVLETIGAMGIGGPSGLAFVPEPGTGLLLVSGVIAACRARRR